MCIEKVKEILFEHWWGAIGALISLKFISPSNWVQASISLIGGTAAAVVVAPVVVEAFGAHLSGAASFIVGLFSMSVFGIVFEIIDRFKKSPVRSIRSISNIFIDVVLATRHGKARREKEN